MQPTDITPIIIAIDGHSSCGKSTMAKALARSLSYIYIDSGAMYRAVALYAIEHQLLTSTGEIDALRLEQAMPEIHISFELDATTHLPKTYLNGRCVEQAIRTLSVSALVSPVAALPFVRAALTQQQQLLGEHKGIVMDGRDIGTTVFPQAELKIFVTATPEVRAQRRYDELKIKGEAVTYEAILENVKQRDYIDSHRNVSPLIQAPDALVLDNSALTHDEQQAWLEAAARRTIAHITSTHDHTD